MLDGLYWPDSDEVARPIILDEVGPAFSWLKHNHTRGWNCCIQAGGNVGVYALRLAEWFRQVFTIEPDPRNAQALFANCAYQRHKGEIHPMAAFLAEKHSAGEIWDAEPGNCGAVRVRAKDGGNVYALTIDEIVGVFQIKPELIWLDIEGMELPALKGAVQTLSRYKPTVICEMKGIGQHYGYADDEIPTFLARFGYAFKSAHGNDQMFQCP